MTPFDYHDAASIDEAVSLYDTYGDDAHYIAGGTSVVLMMRQGLLNPGHLIGLRNIASLRSIGIASDGALEIGALSTHRDVERSELVRQFAPVINETFGHVATVRIRNQATIGGNLVHADPAQDPPPMLLALGAEAVVAGKGGNRTIPLDAFFKDFFETALEPGEILRTIRIPKPAAGARATYIKFLPQSKDDYATVSVAAVVNVGANGICEEARIALGAAGPVPLRITRAEQLLRGKKLDAATIAAAAAAAGEDSDPLDDVRGTSEYKREMARVWTKRALEKLAR